VEENEVKKMHVGMAIAGFVAILGLAGCGDSSTSSTKVGKHDLVTRDILAETPPWTPGTKDINPQFVSELDAFAEAGPVHLIVSNMSYIPERMRASGFEGNDTVLWYVLSRTVVGADWQPGPGSYELYNQRDVITKWWNDYINAVLALMQKHPDMTVTLIINDGYDICGGQLSIATMRMVPPELLPRFDVGSPVPD
jgi:hypothetical protein